MIEYGYFVFNKPVIDRSNAENMVTRSLPATKYFVAEIFILKRNSHKLISKKITEKEQ